MQQSDELSDTAAEMFKQIEELGIHPWSCGFNIINREENTISQWLSSGDGRMVPPFKSPSNEDIFIDFVSAANRGDDFFVSEMGGDSLKSHYEYLTTIPEVGKIAKELEMSGIEFPTFQVFNLAFFKYGYLMFITYEQVPEFQSIFVRFGKVFEQTYTRFLDLKILEAQAIRAQQDLLEIKAARQKAEEALLELRNTQKQLIQSEKMASLGELTAGIAHEIQNPLNFVNNFSEVTEELLEELVEEGKKGQGKRDKELEKELISDIKDNLKKINHHGKRASSIVKGMLEHSRISSGKKELTDINALADEYLRLSYHGLRAKDKSFNAFFETNFDPDLPKIEVIPQDIGRVLLNLINNAFQAVQEEGTRRKEQGDFNYKPKVSITTQLITNNESPITNNKLQITITDNGPGIPDAIKDKIFQPFFTTKDTGKGTGLGLSLAYDIITKGHEGTIELKSVEGEGSKFLITLPLKNV
ncbi:histidine kinase [Lacihabitans sp. LS3-19]|nr:histidine kinase [Lacihabitans sp. LS3-19]